MLSIHKIADEIKSKITIPSGKYLDFIIPNIGSSTLTYKYFIQADRYIVRNIATEHVTIISDSMRLSDQLYDIPAAYNTMIVTDKDVPHTITVSYRIVSTLDDTETIRTKAGKQYSWEVIGSTAEYNKRTIETFNTDLTLYKRLQLALVCSGSVFNTTIMNCTDNDSIMDCAYFDTNLTYRVRFNKSSYTNWSLIVIPDPTITDPEEQEKLPKFKAILYGTKSY